MLARDESPGVYLCSPCMVSSRDYDPATDAQFDAILERFFLSHPATVVSPCRMLGVPARYRRSVWVSIRRLRRRRLLIMSVGWSGGYVCLGTRSVPPERRGRRRVGP